MRIWNRLRSDSSDEMRFHLEERAAELEAEGLEPAEAMRRARIELGGLTQHAERSREQWQFRWLEDLRADTRYGVRALLRSPGYLAAALLSLGLGIGVNTTLFSLTAEFLFSVPSVTSGGTLWQARVGGNSHAEQPYLRFLRENQFFPGVAGIREDGEINWRVGGETRPLHTMRVSDNLFSMAGIPLAMGRGLEPGDVDTAVVSHAMWQGKLSGDPAVLGRVLELDGRPHQIVGVLPEDHRTLLGFGLATEVYLAARPDQGPLTIYLRGPEGASQAAVLERLRAAAQRLDERFPQRDFQFRDDVRVEALGGLDRFKGRTMMGVAAFFGMLMTVGGLLLLIACLNVSNLVLARGASRAREFAVRTSLGAGRGRIVRQLLTEALLLSLAGTAAGLLLNVTLTRSVNRLLPDLPVLFSLRVEPDWRLLAYASAVAIGTALAVGLLPALRLADAGLHDSMKRPGTGLRLRRSLVIGQVAVSIIVLTAAVLFGRNLLASVHVDPGFDLEHTIYVRMRLVPERYPALEAKAAFVERVTRELGSVPGVAAAALTRMVPLNNDTNHGGTLQRVDTGEKQRFRYFYNSAGPDYFTALNVPMQSGRAFSEKEPADSVILNATLARNLFGGGDAAGKAIRIGDNRVVNVVGVARDVKYSYLTERDRPAMFVPYQVEMGHGRESAVYWMVRAQGDPGTLVAPLRDRASALDASAAVEVRPMRSAMGMAMLPSQIGGGLLGAMGALGLALTGIGVYGMLAFSVARRVKEIGLRVALGAEPGRVLSLVLRETAVLIGFGLAIGLAVAVLVTQPLASFLVPEISPSDPFTYALVALLLAAAGLAASAAPARRALKVDPMSALRNE